MTEKARLCIPLINPYPTSVNEGRRTVHFPAQIRNGCILFDTGTKSIDMKKNYIATSLFLMALLFSCKKSKEMQPVNQAPEAVLKVESSAGKLWNRVKIVVDASDPNGKIQSVELFANNKPVGHVTNAPYEFLWDTRDFEDGEVTLKAVVTDDMEETSTPEKKMEVINTLIDYDLHEKFLTMSPNFKYFTFITGKKGELLFFEQIESLPYKKTVRRPEEFDDGKFELHFAYANPGTGSIITISDITPGEFAPLDDDKRGQKIGTAQMKFKDIPEHNYYTYENYTGKSLSNLFAYNTGIYENLNLAYLYLRNDKKGLYKVIENLTEGGMETSLSTTGFEMEMHELTINHKLNGVTFNVFGHTGPGPDAPSVKVFSHHGQVMPSYHVLYHLPHKSPAFDHFSSVISFDKDGRIHSMESYSDPITKPLMQELGAQLSSQKLSEIDIVISGKDPFDMVFSNYYLTNNGFNFSWRCYSPRGDIRFPAIPPQLTQAFAKFSNANLVFAEAGVNLTLQDYDHLDGYGDYLSAFTGRTGKTLKEGGQYAVSVMHQFPQP